MFRFDNRPILVPKNVTVELDGHTVRVKGPKGSLEQSFRSDVSIEQRGEQIIVAGASGARERARRGLARTLIENMMVRVTEGRAHQREPIGGMGYRLDAENGQPARTQCPFLFPPFSVQHTREAHLLSSPSSVGIAGKGLEG